MKRQLFRNCRWTQADFKGHQGKMAFIVEDGKLAWIGPQSKIPKTKKLTSEINMQNQLILPSFIECHTHSVFAGSRADEFEMRNQGISYLEIAAKGGGILSTMRKTREASAKQLQIKAQKVVNRFMLQGVSTLEIKSGYALDLENEIKMLQVIKQLTGPRIISTFLGAHALPAEFKSHGDYLSYLTKEVLPVIKKKKLSSRVDIFIEKNFFEIDAAEIFLKTAKMLGFEITIHANQLSNSGAADLALNLNARSADHVIHLTEKHFTDFAKSKTVAVLLPVADLYMKCPFPQARKLIDAGAMVALATDFNPGSCPTQDLSLVGLLARLEMKMTLPEVFTAYTANAAKALGIFSEEGELVIGKSANFISTDAEISDFFYSAGHMPLHQLFIRGTVRKVKGLLDL